MDLWVLLPFKMQNGKIKHKTLYATIAIYLHNSLFIRFNISSLALFEVSKLTIIIPWQNRKQTETADKNFI